MLLFLRGIVDSWSNLWRWLIFRCYRGCGLVLVLGHATSQFVFFFTMIIKLLVQGTRHRSRHWLIRGCLIASLLWVLCCGAHLLQSRFLSDILKLEPFFDVVTLGFFKLLVIALRSSIFSCRCYRSFLCFFFLVFLILVFLSSEILLSRLVRVGKRRWLWCCSTTWRQRCWGFSIPQLFLKSTWIIQMMTSSSSSNLSHQSWIATFFFNKLFWFFTCLGFFFDHHL